MKNLLLLLIALSIAGIDAFAQSEPGGMPGTNQEPASGNTYFGLAWGPGWSKQNINYEDLFPQPFQYARAFSFGLQYGFPISEELDGQIELCLTQHGYRLEETFFDLETGIEINAKADARIRYLELPLLIAYRVPIGNEGFEVAVIPGISLGYAVSGKVVASGKGEIGPRKVFTKITEEVTTIKDASFADRLDAALLLGGQAAYNFRNGAAFVEARYHLGMLNLERNAEVIINPEGDKAFNRSFLLRLGYRFAL